MPRAPYPRNTRHWEPGSLVIHAADAKDAESLMRVVKYRKDGWVYTEYVEKQLWSGHGRSHWVNHIGVLLDPAMFGIDVEQPAPPPGVNIV